MERSEIVSQILAILEDVAEISPEDVTEDSVLMDDLDLSSMETVSYTHLGAVRVSRSEKPKPASK